MPTQLYATSAIQGTDTSPLKRLVFSAMMEESLGTLFVISVQVPPSLLGALLAILA